MVVGRKIVSWGVLPGQQGLFLAHNRQNGGHVIDGVNVVLGYHRFQGLAPGDVYVLKRATVPQGRAGPGPVSGGYHILGAVTPSQLDRQLGADLTHRSGHEDSRTACSFCHRKKISLSANSDQYSTARLFRQNP